MAGSTGGDLMKKAAPLNQQQNAIPSPVCDQAKIRPPIVTGQCAEVLEILRTNSSVLSFELTANLAIPEAASRIHDLRALGFNILTQIEPEIVFRNRIRRKVARYSLGSPVWPRAGFLPREVAK
jgi:Helix-turn-helix domain